VLSLKKKEEQSVLDPVIGNLITEMNQEEPGSAKYTKMVGELKALVEAKAAEPKPDHVSANTAAVIAGNLIGIAMILIFERKNVITSKSLNLIPKLHS
jgi:hypothetical protein